MPGRLRTREHGKGSTGKAVWGRLVFLRWWGGQAPHRTNLLSPPEAVQGFPARNAKRSNWTNCPLVPLGNGQSGAGQDHEEAPRGEGSVR